jgi:hypothetical protein
VPWLHPVCLACVPGVLLSQHPSATSILGVPLVRAWLYSPLVCVCVCTRARVRSPVCRTGHARVRGTGDQADVVCGTYRHTHAHRTPFFVAVACCWGGALHISVWCVCTGRHGACLCACVCDGSIRQTKVRIKFVVWRTTPLCAHAATRHAWHAPCGCSRHERCPARPLCVRALACRACAGWIVSLAPRCAGRHAVQLAPAAPLAVLHWARVWPAGSGSGSRTHSTRGWWGHGLCACACAARPCLGSRWARG